MSSLVPSDATRKPLSWKAGFLLIAFALFFTAILLEIGLRAAAALRNPARNEGWGLAQATSGKYWAIYDPDLGYRQNPGFGDLNSDGLRDHPIGPKDDHFRVLVLGDSIAVYGDTLDDTFVGHLRAALHTDPTLAPVEVINAGIKGYTNYQEILYLKKYGLKLQPDLVGVEFCLNDLFKFLQTFRVENGKLVPGTYDFSPEALQSAPSWLRRLLGKSYLLNWLRNNLRVATKVAEWQVGQGFSFDYKLDVRTAWQDKPWEDIEQQLQEFVDLGRQNHFATFLMVVPLAVQYRADYLARDRAYVLKPQRKLKEICDHLHIPFYDLYPDMNPGLFVEDGMHLNKAGRQLVGRRIAGFLSGAQLLPMARSSRGKLIGQGKE